MRRSLDVAPSKGAARVEIPIIAYHSLDDSGSVISTSPALFRRQIGILVERGFAAITVSEASAHLDGGEALVTKPIAITFDDGLRSVAEHAAPVLHEAGFRATMFAVAGRVGQDNDWPGQATWAPRQALLSFGELGELAGAGWEIGSHTLDHPDLSRVDAVAPATRSSGRSNFSRTDSAERCPRSHIPTATQTRGYGASPRRATGWPAPGASAMPARSTTASGCRGSTPTTYATRRSSNCWPHRPGAATSRSAQLAAGQGGCYRGRTESSASRSRNACYAGPHYSPRRTTCEGTQLT